MNTSEKASATDSAPAAKQGPSIWAILLTIGFFAAIVAAAGAWRASRGFAPAAMPAEEAAAKAAEYTVENLGTATSDGRTWRLGGTVRKKGSPAPITFTYYFHDHGRESLELSEPAKPKVGASDWDSDGIIDTFNGGKAAFYDDLLRGWYTLEDVDFDNATLRESAKHVQQLFDVYRKLLDVERHRPSPDMQRLPDPRSLPY